MEISESIHSIERALALLVELGIARSRDLEQAGVTRTQIRQLVAQGRIERVGRGLYRRPGVPLSERQDLAEVACRVPLGDDEPVVLAPDFLAAPERQTQWRAFLRRSRLDVQSDTARPPIELREFLAPLLAAAARGKEFERHWPAGGPWGP